jgi:hypothetical protein
MRLRRLVIALRVVSVFITLSQSSTYASPTQVGTFYWNDLNFLGVENSSASFTIRGGIVWARFYYHDMTISPPTTMIELRDFSPGDKALCIVPAPWIWARFNSNNTAPLLELTQAGNATIEADWQDLILDVPNYAAAAGQTIEIKGVLTNNNTSDWTVKLTEAHNSLNSYYWAPWFPPTLPTGGYDVPFGTWEIPKDAPVGTVYTQYASVKVLASEHLYGDWYTVTVVPAPSALPLLMAGLAGLVGLRRKRLLK